jgi:hypothetical protein
MLVLWQTLGLGLKRQVADRDSRMLENFRFRLLVVVRRGREHLVLLQVKVTMQAPS